jgi:putative transcriptional regulator
MKAAAFEELMTSVRQAGAIRRGTLKPARVTKFKPADVKSSRKLYARRRRGALRSR